MNKTFLDASKIAQETIEKIIETSDYYNLKFKALRSYNREHVWQFRYEKLNRTNNGFGGEHFTVLVDTLNQQIKGLIYMDTQIFSGELPENHIAEQAARQFLNRICPELESELKVLWIRRHDEIVMLANNIHGSKKVVVSGVKVKCLQQNSGLYTWVIVSSREKIITFERDVVWNHDMSCRSTEKWLHDNWLIENKYGF